MTLPRIVRHGSVGMRLAEHGPALVFEGNHLVAVSEQPFVERLLTVFEYPASTRHTDEGVVCWTVADGRVAWVPKSAPTGVVISALPDLRLERHLEADGEIVAIAIHGDRVVVGLSNGQIVRLDPDKRRTVLARARQPTAIAFASDGLRVAVGTEAGVVEVVWVAEVKVLTTLSGGRAPVTQVRFSPDQSRILAASGKTVLAWPLRGGPASVVEQGNIAAGIVGFTRAGHLVTTATQQRVAAHDLAKGRVLWELPCYGPAAIDRDRVYSARFQEIRQIDASDGAILHTAVAPQFVEALAPVPGEDRVVVAISGGNELRVADLRAGTWLGEGGGHETDVVCVHFGGDPLTPGSVPGRFVTGGRDSRACLWQRGEPAPVATATAASGSTTDRARAVYLDPERPVIWVAFGERLARHRSADGAWEQETVDLGSPVTAIFPLPGTSTVLACTETTRTQRGTLYLLDAETLAVQHSEPIERTFHRARIRGDGRIKLDGVLSWAIYDPRRRAFLDQGRVASHDPNRRAHRSLDDSRLVELANRVTADGRRVAYLWVTELPAMWRLVEGLETVELSGKADLSASGRWLATPHVDHRVRLWDLDAGTCVAEWDVGAPLTALWFFPDEWRVLGTTREGQLLELSDEREDEVPPAPRDDPSDLAPAS